MSEFKLKAKLRTAVGRQIDKLRLANEIPSVVYGPHIKNRNLTVNYNDFAKILEKAGQSTLIDLAVDEDNPIKVLVHDFTNDPISGRYTHIDFYQLDMNKKLKVAVDLNFIGESPAVKEKGGTLIKVADTIEIECLPKNLVKEIDIDISVLADVGQHIYAKNINLPAGIVLITEPDAVIISSEEIREETISAPVAEIVPASEATATASAPVSGEKQTKTEGGKVSK